MSRLLLVAFFALPLAHAALFLSPGPAWARLSAAVVADLVVAAMVARWFRATRGGGPVRAAETAAPDTSFDPARRSADAMAADASADAARAAALEAANLAAAKARADIDALGELARSSLGEASALAEELDRLGRSSSLLPELSSAMTGARQGSELLRENTDKIFGISSNLANSAEQAFNLSREVESRAASMAGDLASSLAETEDLLAESKRISEILSIMSEISSTTSILSFNASIVAANAGALGRPFAVVAKEMRKLSESTEASLKDIESVLRTIQAKVNAVSSRIRSVNAGVSSEKEALVSVAGELQGVMLANEVVRTVSGLCAQKSAEELELLKSMEDKAAGAVRGLDAGSARARGAAVVSKLKSIVDLTK